LFAVSLVKVGNDDRKMDGWKKSDSLTPKMYYLGIVPGVDKMSWRKIIEFRSVSALRTAFLTLAQRGASHHNSLECDSEDSRMQRDML
jgi:hypothetical protein